MQSRAKLLGHPLHQMLIPLPLGLLVSATILDLVSLLADIPVLGLVSFWNLMLGIVTGGVAAVFGAIDLTVLPYGSRARRVGLVHASANVLALVVFSAALWVRSAVEGGGPPIAVALEVIALGSLSIGGWLGGELVDRMGIGVDEDAHPDAPSSLSKRPIDIDSRTAPRIAHPENVGASAPDTDPVVSRPR